MNYILFYIKRAQVGFQKIQQIYIRYIKIYRDYFYLLQSNLTHDKEKISVCLYFNYKFFYPPSCMMKLNFNGFSKNISNFDSNILLSSINTEISLLFKILYNIFDCFFIKLFFSKLTLVTYINFNFSLFKCIFNILYKSF